MEIWRGRTHVGELMMGNGGIWRNMGNIGEIWGVGDTRGGVDAWMCDSPHPKHPFECKRFHKLTPHYQNIMNILNFLTILNFT